MLGHLRQRLETGAARSLLWSMGAAVTARLGLLALAVVIARLFGPSDYGAFTFATGVALLGAQLAVLGWQMLMNRLIPGMLRDRDWSSLKGLRDAGDMVVLAGCLVVIAALVVTAQLSGHLSTGFALAAALTLPFAFAILRRQQLAAMRLPALGLLFDQGFGAIIAVAILLAIGAPSITMAVLIFAMTVSIGVVIATILFRRRLPRELKTVRRRIEWRLWMSLALPMLVGMSAKLLMNKTDILMLAPLSTLNETGLYGAAFRLTYLLTFPQVVMMSVVTPMLSTAFAHDQPGRVRRLTRGAVLFALATALPFSLPLLLFPGLVMTQLFGPAFAAGAPVLVLLTIGQLATSVSIPFQAVLTMGGRERLYGTLNLSALGLHAVVNLALIPFYGAVGAAVSTMVAAIALSAAQMFLNRQLLVRRPL